MTVLGLVRDLSEELCRKKKKKKSFGKCYTLSCGVPSVIFYISVMTLRYGDVFVKIEIHIVMLRSIALLMCKKMCRFSESDQ